MIRFVALFLLASVAGPLAAADTERQFVGRYTVDKSRCIGELALAEQVHVQLHERKGQAFRALELTAVWEDEMISIEIPLGSGMRQAPGFNQRHHGKVTEHWVTKTIGATLKSESVVRHARAGLLNRVRTALYGTSTGLRFAREVQSRDGIERERCVLIPF